MPVSYIDHVTSTTGPHAFTFDYLDTSHISVLVNGSALAAAPTGFTIDTAAKTVTLAADPGTDANVRILRTTPGLTSSQQAMLVDFQDGSVLSEADLDKACKQLLFIAQEANDRTSSGAIGLDSTLTKFDAENKRISNLAASVDASDAVTKSELENVVIANDGTSDIVPQSYRIVVGTQGTLVNGNQDVQFTLSPAPNSTLKNTFIVEIGGVLQNPDTDFTITVGTTSFITLLGGGSASANAIVDGSGNLQAGKEIIVLNFGRSRNVFNFPATGEASSVTETPLTLKGFSGGNGVSMLSIKDSNNFENARVTAGGTINARQIDPVIGGTLAVNSSTINTTGTITAGGDVSVGSDASITHSSGDATFNNVTISAGSQSSNQAVPKSYVDANGGFVGSVLTTPTNLDTVTTPGLYRGVSHGDNAGANIPISGNNTAFTLRVEPIGTDAQISKVIQTFTSIGERFIRRYSGSTWSVWDRLIDERNSLNQMAAPTSTVGMGGQRLSNVADPTAAQDAVTKNHLDTTVGPFSKIIGINNQCLNQDCGTSEQLLMFAASANISGSFSEFGPSFDNAVSQNIVPVPVSGLASSPIQFFGDQGSVGTGPLDPNANALIKVPANSGAFTMRFESKFESGFWEIAFYKYTAATATAGQRTTIKTWDNSDINMIGTGSSANGFPNLYAHIPNDTSDAFYGISVRVTNTNGVDQMYEGRVNLSRGL